MRTINPFGLRMPDVLRETLQEAAQANGRSLNSEIIHRLQESLHPGSHDARPAAPTARAGKTAERQPAAASDMERLLVNFFRGLQPEAQLGLLTFLRGLLYKAPHRPKGGK